MALPALEDLFSPEELTAIEQSFKRSARHAVEYIENCLGDGLGLDPKERAQIAQDVLDRVGYSKKKQLAVEHSGEVHLPDHAVFGALQGLATMMGMQMEASEGQNGLRRDSNGSLRPEERDVTQEVPTKPAKPAQNLPEPTEKAPKKSAKSPKTRKRRGVDEALDENMGPSTGAGKKNAESDYIDVSISNEVLERMNKK